MYATDIENAEPVRRVGLHANAPMERMTSCRGVAVVIVTYGSRWQYLKKVLEHVERHPSVVRVVVVDNASPYDVAGTCSADGYSKTAVIRNDRNLGSAGGFSLGISAACDGASSFILLLDDDNVPEEGSIEGLISTYHEVSENLHSAKVVVFGFRECLHGRLRIPVRPPFMHGKDFLCFNLFNALQRHFAIVEPQQLATEGTAFATTSGGVAYSGMMFRPSLVADIGLPDTSFVLYFDDFEFSKRMLSRGYTLWLDSSHRINDIIDNYSASVYRTPFLGFLQADSDSKVYYNVRNRVHLDFAVDKKMSLPYMINVVVFLSSFCLLCLLFLRGKRWRTVANAFRDGKKGQLGFNVKYPL